MLALGTTGMLRMIEVSKSPSKQDKLRNLPKKLATTGSSHVQTCYCSRRSRSQHMHFVISGKEMLASAVTNEGWSHTFKAAASIGSPTATYA